MSARHYVCAWCGESDDDTLDPSSQTTHGLCPSCFTARMADVLVPGARERCREWSRGLEPENRECAAVTVTPRSAIAHSDRKAGRKRG